MEETREPFHRALGLLSLTALGINSVIGTGIFLTPGDVATHLNGWSVWAFGLGGVLCYAIALCFAEMAALVPQTGGAYAYAKATFGPLVGFLVGWIIWLSAVLGWASVAVPLADMLGASLKPALGYVLDQHLLLVVVVALLSCLNALGTQVGALSNTILAVVKLLPLAVFVGWTVGGLKALPLGHVSASDGLAGSLLILYTFSGFEEIPVPAGETADPQRTIPRALAAVLGFSTVIYMIIQAVVCSTGSFQAPEPLKAAVSGTAWLVAAIGGAALASMASVNASIAFTSPRSLWALTQEKWAWLATLHPTFRTPWRAIFVNAVLTLLLAWSSTFEKLAMLSALASLLQYVPTVLAVMVWRYRKPEHERAFRMPGGYSIPLVALVVCIVLIVTSNQSDLLGALEAIVAGLILYGLQRLKPAPASL